MSEMEKSASEGLFGFLTRRKALKYGLAGGSFLLMGGVGGLLGMRGCAADVDGLKCLSPQEYRTLVALAQTHIPAGGPFAEGAEHFDIARLFDGYLANEPEENRSQLQSALMLVEYGPVFFGGRLTTFSHLDAKAQLEHWRSWIESPRLLQRQVALAFRKFFSLVFYDRPEVWKHIGYPGPSFGGGKP